MPAGQVRGVPQPPGARVEGARGADDDPVDVGAGEPGLLHRPVQRVGHLAHHAVGTPAGCRQLELPDRRPGHVRDGGDDAPLVHIEPRHMGGARVHHVELRVGSGAPLAGPGGDDQTGRLQPGQELRGGGLGQARELADPGAGERAVLQQQIEGGPVVHGPQYPGVPGVVPVIVDAPTLVDSVRKLSYSGRTVRRRSPGRQWGAPIGQSKCDLRHELWLAVRVTVGDRSGRSCSTWPRSVEVWGQWVNPAQRRPARRRCGP